MKPIPQHSHRLSAVPPLRSVGGATVWRAAALALGLICLAGCRQGVVCNGGDPAGVGLVRFLADAPTIETIEPWRTPESVAGGREGLVLTTRHYRIYTTLTDPLILRRAPLALESAYRAYVRPIGRDPLQDHKLTVYFFAEREEWEDFTRGFAGPAAPIYLQLQAGAYYHNGACVAYHLNRAANFSVLIHEGWHQFSAELFKLRLPAWLDEGLATNFEGQVWEGDRLRFAPAQNLSRLAALQVALLNDAVYSLDELLTLEPGGLLGRNGYDDPEHPQLATYYAQVYALVRFLREYDYGRYRPRFEAMLAGAYEGTWPLPESLLAEAAQRDHNPSRGWNRQVGTAVFGHYLGEPAAFAQQYDSFCRRIAATVRVAP